MQPLTQLLAKAQVLLQAYEREDASYQHEARHASIDRLPRATRPNAVRKAFAVVATEVVEALRTELGPEVVADLQPPDFHYYGRHSRAEGEFMQRVWRLLAGEVLVDFNWDSSGMLRQLEQV